MIRRMSGSSFSVRERLEGTIPTIQSFTRLVRRLFFDEQSDTDNHVTLTWADVPPQLTVSDLPLQWCAVTHGPLNRSNFDARFFTISHSRYDRVLNCVIICSCVAFEIHCMVCVLFVDDDDVDLQYALGDFGLPFASFRRFMNLASAYSAFLITCSMVSLHVFQGASHDWPGQVSAWIVILVKRGEGMVAAERLNEGAERERPEFIQLWIKTYILYVGAIAASCVSAFLGGLYTGFDIFYLIPLNGWWSVLRSSFWALVIWVPGTFTVVHIIFTTAEYLSEMLFHTYIVERVRSKLLDSLNRTSNEAGDSSGSTDQLNHAVQRWKRGRIISSLNLLDVSRRHLGQVGDIMSVITFIFQVGLMSTGLLWLYFVAYFSVTPAIIILSSLALCLCLLGINGIAIPALRVRFLFSRLNPLLHGILVSRPITNTRLSVKMRLRIWATLAYVDEISEEGVLWVGCCYPLVGSAYCYSLLEAATYFLLLISVIGTPDEEVMQQVLQKS